MPLRTKVVTVTTTAAPILAADSSRTAVWLRNESAVAAEVIRVGPAGVTNAGGAAATRGFSIPVGEIVPFIGSPQGGDNVAALEWYAISDSGSPTLSILENDQFS